MKKRPTAIFSTTIASDRPYLGDRRIWSCPVRRTPVLAHSRYATYLGENTYAFSPGRFETRQPSSSVSVEKKITRVTVTTVSAEPRGQTSATMAKIKRPSRRRRRERQKYDVDGRNISTRASLCENEAMIFPTTTTKNSQKFAWRKYRCFIIERCLVVCVLIRMTNDIYI